MRESDDAGREVAAGAADGERRERAPPALRSIFEAARRGWNVKLTCWRCGHVRILDSAALWLRMSLKDLPDDLRELPRYCKCTRCRDERNEGINRPRLTLCRDAPTGEPMKMPTARQWKDGLRWQRR